MHQHDAAPLQIHPSDIPPPRTAAVRGARRPVSVPLLLPALLLLTALAAPPAAAQAAEPADADGGVEATRTETAETAETEEAEAEPATPTAAFEQRLEVTALAPELATEDRLPGEELESGAAADAVEHLRGEPGLGAARRGGINLDPQVRGLSETQVATFVDGSRTFAAGPGRMDSGLSHLNPHAVETVQVVKGPYALTWGAGALSAVRLDTWRPAFDSGLTGRAGARWGDNGSLADLFTNLAYGDGSWRLTLLAGHRSGDDYESGSGAEVPADFTSTEGRLQLGMQPVDGVLLEIEGGYQDQSDLDYPGRLLDATYFQTRSYAGRATWTPAAGGVDEVIAFVYANRKDHLMNNDAKPTARPMPGRMPPFAIGVHLPTEANTTGGRLELAGRAGAAGPRSAITTWSAGADLYRLEQTAERTISRRNDGRVLFADRVWPDAEIDDAGLFGRLTHGAGPWSLSGTVRWDRWQASAGTVSAFFLDAAGPAADRSEDSWSAAVAGRLRLAEGWVLSAGAGRAVRTPTAQELYSDRFPSTRFQVAAEFVGDPDLDPEVSQQLDLGLAYHSGDFTVQVDGFLRRLDDYVTVLPDATLPKRLPLSPNTVFRYVNGARAEFMGAEARLTARLGDGWRLRAGASWIRGDDEELDEPVFGLTPPSATLGLRWQSPAAPWWLDAAVRTVDRQDRVAVTRLERETPGHTVVDLHGGWHPGERWRLAAGVDNLLDEAYADHLNSLNPFTGRRIEEPGRSLFARAEVRF